MAEALCYEAAKAHTREGRHGRTSNRLAQRLFEGLDWEVRTSGGRGWGGEETNW